MQTGHYALHTLPALSFIPAVCTDDMVGAGPNVIFGDSGCTTLSMLLQPRPNPDGTIVFNEAVMSIALLWLKIGAHGAAALTRALKGHLSRDGCTWLYNQHLTTLRLARNRLEDEGAREIAEIFSPRRSDGDWVYCTAIEHLDLSFNNVGDAGARALAQAFGPRENGDGKWVWPPLTKLNMYGKDGRTESTLHIAYSMLSK